MIDIIRGQCIIRHMGKITPITKDLARGVEDKRIGHYGVVSDFIAVVDGTSDLVKALRQAKSLIQIPENQAVVVMRESSTLKKSEDRLFDSFFHREFHQPKRGIVVSHKEGKHLKFDPPGLTSRRTQEFRRVAYCMPSRVIGHDYNEVFKASRQVFPEYLSWDMRTGKNRNPGGLHFDAAYEQASNNVIKRLPHSFSEDILKEKFNPLSGSITMTVSIRGGGSVVVRCDRNDYPEQHFDDFGKQGFQTQDGDITIFRGKGWENPEQLASYHCSPLHSVGRDVAVLSSYASYLSPKILKMRGDDLSLS